MPPDSPAANGENSVPPSERLSSATLHELLAAAAAIKAHAQLLRRRQARLGTPNDPQDAEGLAAIDQAVDRLADQLNMLRRDES